MTITLVSAHAMAMILALITCGSTGIFIARYGRSFRFSTRRQLLGKAVWFQIHRFLLSSSSLLIMLGFFIILVKAEGRWINPGASDLRLFLHSIFGVTIVCCSVVQIWLALYRCNPHSHFRYIFDWSHRITGLLLMSLSIPTIYLITSRMSKYSVILMSIFSVWTVWIIIVIVICEKIQYRQRVLTLPIANNAQQSNTNQENANTNARLDIETGSLMNAGNQYHNKIKLLLFISHFFISIIVSVLLMIFLCK